MNKTVVSVVAAAVIAGGVGFYGGRQYGQGQAATLSASMRSAQNDFRGGAGRLGGRQNGGQNVGGFTAGEILSRDDKSITIKMRDGSTKIVFFSASTGIGKTTEGAATDLTVGKQVTVNGVVNSDGSVTAQSIQLRPALPVAPRSNSGPVQD